MESGGEEGSEPGFQLRWVGVKQERGGGGYFRCETLAGELVLVEEGAVRGGFRVGWALRGWGVHGRKSELPLTCLLTPAHSPSAFKFSSKFRKSQKMPLNIPTKEKLSKCWCKAGGL